jgi:hypothetical protein
VLVAAGGACRRGSAARARAARAAGAAGQGGRRDRELCVLFIANGCDAAISCDAAMATTCKSGTEMVEATRRKRDTFAAKTDGEITLKGECPSGEILATAVKSIACK